jgi:hypothetical protein
MGSARRPPAEVDPTSALRIFISYRRDDAPDAAGRLYDTLVAYFEGRVFMDVDTIEPGLDFVEVINNAVASCDVLIALIGRGWLTSRDAQGRRRLDNPEDFVRLEIEAALKREVRVIPVLLHDVSMPSGEQLPDSLGELARRNALELDYSRWRDDVGRLLKSLEKLARERAEQPRTVSPAQSEVDASRSSSGEERPIQENARPQAAAAPGPDGRSGPSPAWAAALMILGGVGVIIGCLLPWCHLYVGPDSPFFEQWGLHYTPGQIALVAGVASIGTGAALQLVPARLKRPLAVGGTVAGFIAASTGVAGFAGCSPTIGFEVVLVAGIISLLGAASSLVLLHRAAVA